MVTRYEFELPWPVSTNRYWRHTGKFTLLSREARRYRMMAVSRLAGMKPLEGDLSLTAHFYPPDRRRRDLDNVGGKCLIDSMMHAGLMRDDHQIKRIHLEMLEPMDGGKVFVVLETLVKDNDDGKEQLPRVEEQTLGSDRHG